MAFRLSILGYNKKQVNQYLARAKANDSEVLQRQNRRIMSLRDENEKLVVQLSGYKHKERAIVSAMIDSRKIAETIVVSSRRRAIDELQALVYDIDFANNAGGISPYQMKMAIYETCQKLSKQIVEIKRTNIKGE